ncbi:MAG: ABC transporter substrate-binding protein [Mesorhizobium sp. 61-13]|jgi:urea transport system substrate-binding protein|uniref:transporter substrate-binding domain-containing protein n=1 Tax=Mesorhizobium sp. Root552 TaxID=1736555 RepID=UPI0006F93DBE|nr:transporter substrate-binding domain-containing protein [Mesorhizobium sp. Root552]KQZ31861.1 ABC transporter substrate-binding protein [Mesorhizobium sp. Root552]OJU51221.1 MAG: ABC transporter substrate-binding protein [Mesorhizobium sp. 61-13]
MTKQTRRTFLKVSTLAAAGLATPSILRLGDRAWAADEIPVGIMYSLTGTTAIVEKSMNQCAQMAIDEINAKGGVLGKKLRPIIEDPASEPRIYGEKARKLTIEDQVPVIFGCYTTASRKAVLPVVEKRNGLLVWPTWYEGEECSKNVLYAGSAVPNQQLENSIPWLQKTLGKNKLFIVGSDYAFPRGMGKTTKTICQGIGMEVVGDEYLPLGHTEWASMVSKIGSSGADVIFSNVVGDSIVAFYRELRNQGYDFEKLPLCASTTTEVEIKAMGPEYALGSYVSLPYFQTVDTPQNKTFVEAFKAYAGADSVTHAAMEAVYVGVNMWAMAAEKAGDVSPEAVVANAGGLSFDAPQGKVTIDPQNLHSFLTPRIGKTRADGLLDIVDQYAEPLQPLPYSSVGETADKRICTTSGATL